MSLTISEKQNDELKIRNTANNLDKPLTDRLPDPLPNYNGFCMVIAGASGSGKTTFLYSIMTKNKIKGIRQSYKKVFDKIYVVSGTIGSDSMKNDPFRKLPAGQKYETLTEEALNEIDEKIQASRDDDENSIIIFDDVGSQLRKKAGIEKKLVQMVQNRRHLYTSMIFLVQRFRDVPTGIRNNMSHFVTFKMKNRPETEAIMNELFNFDKKQTLDILSYIFDNDDKYSFLFVDMSLKLTNMFRFFKKFNELQIEVKGETPL